MKEKEVKDFLDETFKDHFKVADETHEAYFTKKQFFQMLDNYDKMQEWIIKARKLFNAIKFNTEHPSKNRDVVGGLEVGLIDDLLNENLLTTK